MHSLTLGSLLLTNSLPDDDNDFVFNVLADGVGFGVVAGAREVITSLLSDGDLIRTTRYGNREVSFVVEITGPDLASLAHGEAALRREVGRGNTLTWQPPDDFATPTVFEVVASEMAQRFDDLDELRTRRKFALTLTCSPFARSADSVSVDALAPPPVSPTTVTITNADTTTGFSASGTSRATGANPSLTVTDLGAGVGASFDGWSLTLRYIPASPASLSGTPYLMLELTGTPPNSFYVGYAAGGGGGTVAPALVRATTSGTTLYVLPVDPTKSLERVEASYSNFETLGAVDEAISLNIYDISRTDTLPHVSPRQVSRIIEVGGTERAPASLHAGTGSGFLGTTMLHTTRYRGAGYTPGMRRWRATGNTPTANVDARKITGTWEPMRPNAVVSRTPAHSLPRSDYILMAAIKSDTGGRLPIDWAVKSVAGGVTFGEVSGRSYWNFTVANEITIVGITSLAAPVIRGSALDVEVHLLNPTSTVAMSVEEWWMFTDDEDSALSIVNTSEGNLWLDSADVNSSVPTVWVGPEKGSANHPGAGLITQGVHTFQPGSVMVTSVSDSNDYVEVDLTYHERWHSNAAR